VNDTVIQINELGMVLEILLKFDPKQLTALTEILRLGSFEAAADALGVTQSAISQRLKALEDNFGSILVALPRDGCRPEARCTRQ
jgi:molybdenum-dependent DNA-binding transcriptional regulator ModE